MKRFAGVIPAAVTPFSRTDGRVDHKRLHSHIQWLSEAGVDGMLVLGSTGESATIDEDERRGVLETSREALPDGRLFLVGVGAESTMRTIRQAKEAAACGADAALVVTPSYYMRSDLDGLRGHYVAVADASPIPVFLYNVPVYTQLQLPVAVALDLAHHPNIVGIKDSSGDLTQLYNLVSESPVGWAVFTGSSGLAAACMSGGGAGAMTACANYAPELMVDIRIAVEMGDMEAAMSLQRMIVSLERVVGRYLIAGVKEACDLRGHPVTPVRPPLRPTPDQGRREIAAALRAAGLSIVL